MKVWPIITLVGLIWGSTLADPHSVGREGKPHPRHHLSEFDPDDFIAPNMPHRPVTMAFREVFQKLLNEETDWSAPDGKATAQAEADADDGQDPGKKLFWSTNHPDITGVPFPGWGDPDPIVVPNPVVSPACSTCRPELFFTIIEDPTPPKEDENFAVEAQAHAVFGNLLFGALKALDNMVIATGSGEASSSPSRPARRSWSTASAQCHARATMIPCAGMRADPADSDRAGRTHRRRSNAAAFYWRG